ncbi:hypothetical protein PR048_011966 [Dryococelus australis]|uniref:Uncharacterized protein n=1 Tax=Dryococelus australis TaxID=614101 RepID=A0ABQ9HN07_9NEOP|nr:hypothetical protein PR048_011966 [Dryococelus australis]
MTNSCVNVCVQETNQSVKKLCDEFNNVEVIDVYNLLRECFTRHGLHTNNIGNDTVNWGNARIQGRRKLESPENIHQPAASSGTIDTCENQGASSSGIEPDSPRIDEDWCGGLLNIGTDWCGGLLRRGADLCGGMLRICEDWCGGLMRIGADWCGGLLKIGTDWCGGLLRIGADLRGGVLRIGADWSGRLARIDEDLSYTSMTITVLVDAAPYHHYIILVQRVVTHDGAWFLDLPLQVGTYILSRLDATDLERGERRSSQAWPTRAVWEEGREKESGDAFCDGDYVAARSMSRSERVIRATVTRTPGASSLLRARRAVFPSLRCTVEISSDVELGTQCYHPTCRGMLGRTDSVRMRGLTTCSGAAAATCGRLIKQTAEHTKVVHYLRAVRKWRNNTAAVA